MPLTCARVHTISHQECSAEGTERWEMTTPPPPPSLGEKLITVIAKQTHVTAQLAALVHARLKRLFLT